MKKAIQLISLFALIIISNSITAQTFYKIEGSGFGSDKITVTSISSEKISVKISFPSIARCACESYVVYTLTKNAKGEFKYYLNEDPEVNNYIAANLYNGKINSIVINNNDISGCCDVVAGSYILKPAPVKGSKKSPKILGVNAASERFLEFWKNFQSNLDNKNFLIDKIDFPYSISCNYLETTSISKSDFDLHGTDIFINSNAFLTNAFSKRQYPDDKGLFIGAYTGGYLNAQLNEMFVSKYRNLNNIYFVSLFSKQEEAFGPKAYFRETDDGFKFIGYENIEQGD